LTTSRYGGAAERERSGDVAQAGDHRFDVFDTELGGEFEAEEVLESTRSAELCINGNQCVGDRFDRLEARPHVVGEVMTFGEV
jgi:hypothetical protein